MDRSTRSLIESMASKWAGILAAGAVAAGVVCALYNLMPSVTLGSSMAPTHLNMPLRPGSTIESMGGGSVHHLTPTL